MEWSDMPSQESQDDWIMEKQKQNFDIEAFMQRPANFDISPNENDSDYYSTFPSTGPKQMFKVTCYSSSQASLPSSASSPLPSSEEQVKKDNCLNVIDSSELMQQNKLNALSIRDRMKLKKKKAKQLFEKKGKKEDAPTNQTDTTIPINEEDDLTISLEGMNNTVLNEMINKKTKRDSFASGENTTPTDKALTKKEIKMLRNRASAQRSRDRRKREFDELHLFTRSIQKENEQLKAEIAKRDVEMEKMRTAIASLCGNCKSAFNFFNNERSECRIDIGEANVNSAHSKYSLIAGLFVILCVIGTIAINTTSSVQAPLRQTNTKRLLQEKPLPFEIVKDYSNRKAKEAEFLHRKRKEFLLKDFNVNEMKIDNIHEEQPKKVTVDSKNDNAGKNLSTQVVPLSFYEDRQDIRSLMCKDFITSNEKNLFKHLFQSAQFHSSAKINPLEFKQTQLVEETNLNALSKQLNLRHDYDLKQHVKDFPEDPIVETPRNCSLDMESKPTATNDLILHMLIPTESQMEAKSTSQPINTQQETDNTFYEVGCKIFEINKIYK